MPLKALQRMLRHCAISKKRKLDSLSKVLDKEIITLQKTEKKILRPNHFEHNPELDTDSHVLHSSEPIFSNNLNYQDDQLFGKFLFNSPGV